MPTGNLGYRNIARAPGSYWDLRESVYSFLRRNTNPITQALPNYLSKTMYSIDEIEDWRCLPVTASDIDTLDFLLKGGSRVMHENYLELALQYCERNQQHIRHLCEVERQLSKHLLESNIPAMQEVIDACSPLDRQSLLILRATAGIKSAEHGNLKAVFDDAANSVYVRKSLAQPLLYFFVNLPNNNASIKLHLRYAVASTKTGETQRQTFRYLIGGDHSATYTLGFIAYLGLLSHPYDAWSSLVGFFLKRLAQGSKLHGNEKEAIRRLHAMAADDCEVQALYLLAFPTDYSQQLPLPLTEYLGVSAEVASFLSEYFDLSSAFTAKATENYFIKVFSALREARYPDRINFDSSAGFYARYWFLKAGRLALCCMTSQYLLSRSEPEIELLHVLRLSFYLGKFDAYVASSPGGLESAEAFVFPSTLPKSFEPQLNSLLAERGSVQDRGWIKLLHAAAFGDAKAGRIAAWLKLLRGSLNVEPEYLTGINWDWFEQVIDKTKLRYFRDKPDGIFMLLLRLIENGDGETTALKVSLEPIASKLSTIAEFAEWALKEFGEDSIAFFQYALTPGVLLRLEFTESYFEALSERFSAYERYREAFGFTKLLNEKTLSQELEIFETELMLLNVGANQFEVAWNIIKSDALSKYDEYYRTIEVLKDIDEKDGAMPRDALYPLLHTFPAGQQVRYSFPHRLHAPVSLVVALIEFFMRHPSQGIESILSVRIRHTNFKRQFEDVLNSLRHGKDHPKYVKKYLDELEAIVYPIIAKWLEDYMHQNGPDKPNGMFKFIPDEQKLRELSMHSDGDEFSDFIDKTFKFLSDELDSCLVNLRSLVANELAASLTTAINGRRASLVNREPGIKEHVSDLIDAAIAALRDRCASLQEWFNTIPQNPDAPATPTQMEVAIRGRYRTDLDHKRLVLRTKGLSAIDFAIPRALARNIFHLVCEITNNALKYGTKPTTTMTITSYVNGSEQGLCFSSTRPRGLTHEEVVEGDPTSYSELLFTEGRSGRKKIAALSAAVIGSSVCIRISASKEKYRVFVPFRI